MNGSRRKHEVRAPLKDKIPSVIQGMAAGMFTADRNADLVSGNGKAVDVAAVVPTETMVICALVADGPPAVRSDRNRCVECSEEVWMSLDDALMRDFVARGAKPLCSGCAMRAFPTADQLMTSRYTLDAAELAILPAQELADA